MGGGVCLCVCGWEGVCVFERGVYVCVHVWEGVCVFGRRCVSVCVWLGGGVWVQVFPKVERKN